MLWEAYIATESDVEVIILVCYNVFCVNSYVPVYKVRVSCYEKIPMILLVIAPYTLVAFMFYSVATTQISGRRLSCI